MIKKVCVAVSALCVLFESMVFSVLPTIASTERSVVMSEIAWAGSADSASDEWIELYNNTSTVIDLTGWTIEDDNGAQIYELIGNIPAHGYFLLESRETATSVPADQVRSLSLSNAGDGLVLKDLVANTIDTANSASGTWPAGSNTTHATMERISLTTDGNTTNNWRTSSETSTATASSGNSIVGSPKTGDSTITPPQSTTQMTLRTNQTTIAANQTVTLSIAVENVQSLTNWGVDLSYDATKLSYQSSIEGTFLSEGGTIETSFQSALQNGQSGTVVLAGARTIKPLSGVSGNGELFSITFVAQESAAGNTTIAILPNSFLSTPTSPISLSLWPTTTLTIADTSTVEPISNLAISPGNERYSIALTWTASPTDNARYEVYRKARNNQFELLGIANTNRFLDNDSVTLGGNIIPQHNYTYKVVTTTNNIFSQPIMGDGSETRGLKGDTNRSDRVDGKDLEALARVWTIDNTQTEFKPLVDTSFDGIVNGSDLIDLAVNWAKIYS